MKIEILNIQVQNARKVEKCRMYLFPENFNVGDNFLSRVSGKKITETTFYKNSVLPKVIEFLKKNDPVLYYEIKDSKWGWSKRAGCDCGCSPGFVSQNIKNRNELFVHYKVSD